VSRAASILRLHGSSVVSRSAPSHLKTVSAYLFKDAIQQLWDYNSPAWAGKLLDDWCRQVMRSRIEPMKKIARSLRQHRGLILNYFRAQKLLSSGVVAGPEQQAQSNHEKILWPFAPTASSNSPSITHLASYPSPRLPTISSVEIWDPSSHTAPGLPNNPGPKPYPIP